MYSRVLKESGLGRGNLSPRPKELGLEPMQGSHPVRHAVTSSVTVHLYTPLGSSSGAHLRPNMLGSR
jgi:hypothetical protein